MNNLKNIKKIYFIGIGGIGMSALARYFKANGAEVSGYDKTSSLLTDALMREGMRIHFKEDLDRIPKDVELVVYTAAISSDHAELKYYREHDFQVKKRAEVLGIISRSMFNISVAGSHGKTTVSTMIAHILKETEYDCTAFLGGISVNYNTNLLLGENDLIVVEADEYDRSFLSLFPNIAVITAIDADHLEVYGSMEEIENAFAQFAQQINSDGTLIVKYGLPVIEKARCSNIITYSFDDPKSDCYVSNFEIEDGAYVFDISLMGEVVTGFKLQVGGLFNMENALASIVVVSELGLDFEVVRDALYTFKGIKRRFEVIYKSDDKVYIDDYAHHPKEISALLKSVRGLHPEKKITIVFQPHLYTRTRDLADAFAESLSMADEVILLDIYPAREAPIPGVSSQLILDKIGISEKKILRKEELVASLKANEVEVFLTVGAGNIDEFIFPLRKWFENNEAHLA